MNIFFLDKTPEKSAEFLCDKHIPKMLLESAQMLSTAVRKYEEDTEPIYKSAYPNHPMTKWVGFNRDCFNWALENAIHIHEEYRFRFNKNHKSYDVISNIINNNYSNDIPEGFFKEPPQCMPDEYKHKNYVTAYRSYYAGDKDRFAKWEKGRSKPKWYEKIKNTIKTSKEETGQKSTKRPTNKKRDSYSYQMGTSA